MTDMPITHAGGRIVDGHARAAAATQLGLHADAVPAYPGLGPAEARLLDDLEHATALLADAIAGYDAARTRAAAAARDGDVAAARAYDHEADHEWTPRIEHADERYYLARAAIKAAGTTVAELCARITEPDAGPNW